MKNLGMHYILKDKKIVVAKDILEWARFFEKRKQRRVGWKTCLDGITISTVFIGIDHGIFEDLPVLFESMVFPWPVGISDYFTKEGNWDKEMNRYRTWEEAEKGHRELVDKYRVRDPLKIIRCTFYPFSKIIAIYAFLYLKGIFYFSKTYYKKNALTFVKRSRKVFSRFKNEKTLTV